MRYEHRAAAGTVELRASKRGQQPLIVGYAAVFYRAGRPGTEYELWPGAIERIMPGAFDAAIDEADDVRAMFDHRVLLGRRAAGTLRLYVDSTGLRYEIEPTNTTAYRDTAEHVRLGNITGSSFAFKLRPDGERWRAESGREVREVWSVSLFDVGPVVNPAYTATTAVAKLPAKAGRSNPADVARERAKREAHLRRAYLRQMKVSA